MNWDTTKTGREKKRKKKRVSDKCNIWYDGKIRELRKKRKNDMK